MRILALDVGDRRIGVALSDPMGVIATPLLTLWRTAERKDQGRIAELVATHEVELMVVGLPKTLRGEVGPQAQRVLRFGGRLARLLTVPVVYWDERYSTADAERIVRNQGHGGRRAARDPLDHVAAAIVLQHYLDSLAHSSSAISSSESPGEEGQKGA